MTFARRPAAVAVLLVLAHAGGVLAQTSPYQIGVSETVTRYTNLRLTTTPTPDWESSTKLFAGINQPIGRQRLFANASVGRNKFRNNTIYDNTSHNITGGLDWATVGNLSGNFTLANDKALAPFDTGRVSASTRNIQQTRKEAASVRLGGVTALTFTGSLSHSKLTYSDPAVSVLDVNQNAGSLGVVYNRGGQMTLGAALRATRGEYPNAVGGADKFRRNDLDLTGTYSPTGSSTFDARLSFGRQRDDFATQRDFSGVTGSIGWNWAATGKIRVNTRLTHDTGSELTFAFLDTPVGPLGLSTDTATVADALQVGVNYAATAKVNFDATLYHLHRDLVDTTAFGSSGGTDNTTKASLGVHWTPRRFVQLGCSASHTKRNASSSGITSYTANTLGCNAQLTLQP